MAKKYQGTVYQLMRELVVLSINISYIKDAMQHNERYKAQLMYLNFPTGTLDVTMQNLVRRKVILQNRFKALVEIQLLEQTGSISDCLITVLPEQAGFRKKELEQGWAIIPDIYEVNWLLNIRTGDLLEENFTNTRFFVSNIKKLGSVYFYFGIDINNPLPHKDIRY